MEKKYFFTELDVITKSHDLIHFFYDRQIEPIVQMLDKNFVWIGAYELQYLVGREEFLKSIESESNEAPVHVSDEQELHCFPTTIVYGQFMAGSQLLTKWMTALLYWPKFAILSSGKK